MRYALDKPLLIKRLTDTYTQVSSVHADIGRRPKSRRYIRDEWDRRGDGYHQDILEIQESSHEQSYI